MGALRSSRLRTYHENVPLQYSSTRWPGGSLASPSALISQLAASQCHWKLDFTHFVLAVHLESDRHPWPRGREGPAPLWTVFIGPVRMSMAASIDGSWYLRCQSSLPPSEPACPSAAFLCSRLTGDTCLLRLSCPVLVAFAGFVVGEAFDARHWTRCRTFCYGERLSDLPIALFDG